jgi:hypothetical protein
MRSFNSVPGASGIFGIIIATLAVSVIMTGVTGSWTHWPILILAIVVGLMAVKSINR